MVNLRELAEQLGLSQGTVSRALNDYPDVNEETRKRVKEMARRTGYRANSTARRLARGAPETVAFLLPTEAVQSGDTVVYKVLAGVSSTLATRGWDLLIHPPAQDDDEIGALERLLESDRVAGVIVARPYKEDPRIDVLRKANVPFVVHGRDASSEDYAWFDVDGATAMAEAVAHLNSLGHKRIGFIGAPTSYSYAQMRLEGYRAGMANAGVADTRALERFSDQSDHGGESAAADLLDLAKPPTAIVCVTDVLAMGALRAIRARGLRPGRCVSVIGFDGLQMSRHSNPPLSTMAQPIPETGRILAEMLLAVIEGGEPKDFQTLSRAKLIRRESDGPAPAMSVAAS